MSFLRDFEDLIYAGFGGNSENKIQKDTRKYFSNLKKLENAIKIQTKPQEKNNLSENIDDIIFIGKSLVELATSPFKKGWDWLNEKECIKCHKCVSKKIFNLKWRLCRNCIDDERMFFNYSNFDNFYEFLDNKFKIGDNYNILRSKIMATPKYDYWRKEVYKKSNYQCKGIIIKNGKYQVCNKNNIRLEAHHIISLHKIITKNNVKTLFDALNCEELWDVKNGKALCHECHEQTDSHRWNRVYTFRQAMQYK